MTIQTVRFFTKPGCHLCEQAEELLEQIAQECPLDLEHIDITEDMDIFDRYRYEIPVIAVEGGGTASGRITDGDLRRILRLGPARPPQAVPPVAIPAVRRPTERSSS